MGISESFLKPDKTDQMAYIPGYTLLRYDRLNNGGGGVALYLAESARCKIIGSSSRPDEYRKRPEFLPVVISVGMLKLLCALVSNPPKADYWSDVEEAI